MITKHLHNARYRQGTTIVETAIVLPVLLFLLFAIIEFGHAQLVNNMLNAACRSGARLGAVEGTSTADVLARVNQTLSPIAASADVSIHVGNAGVFDSGGEPPTDGAAIEALPPIELSGAEARQMFVVRATVNYNDVALVPMEFMDGVVLSSQAFMRHE